MNKEMTKQKSSKDMGKWLSKLGPLVALVVLVILVTIMNPSFLSSVNLLNLLRQVSVNALIAFGMTFVILTGGIDLSVGSTLALSGAFVAGLISSGMSPLLAMIAGLMVGAILGMINGLLIAKGNMAFIQTGIRLPVLEIVSYSNLSDVVIYLVFRFQLLSCLLVLLYSLFCYIKQLSGRKPMRLVAILKQQN